MHHHSPTAALQNGPFLVLYPAEVKINDNGLMQLASSSCAASGVELFYFLV